MNRGSPSVANARFTSPFGCRCDAPFPAMSTTSMLQFPRSSAGFARRPKVSVSVARFGVSHPSAFAATSRSRTGASDDGGNRYARAIAEVGGSVGSICDDDWTPILASLGVVAVGILEEFTLSQPADLETIEVFVDEVPVPQDPEDGWTYDWQSSLLTFHGDAIPPRDAEIRVEYEISFDATG